MFHLKKTKLDSKECVNIIENIVYEHLKTLGFKKYGRTLHRFVDEDISQVVHFQNGCPQKGVYDILWINLGIRVPECEEKNFPVSQPQKKYYHEYNCNIRTRLGYFVDKKDTFYDLRKDPIEIGNNILERLKKHVLPVFETLNSRDSILKYRKNYVDFDQLNNRLILLDEAMIYGNQGNMSKAGELFNQYYDEKIKEYRHDFEYGSQHYLSKGDRVEFLNTKTKKIETIVANKSGYVTLYNANDGHIKYLEDLAKKLNIQLISDSNTL